MSNDGGSAFPSPEIRAQDGTGICAAEYGMTLRDYLAAKAMHAFAQGVNNLGGHSPQDIHKGFEALAEFSYRVADAMLAERSK